MTNEDAIKELRIEKNHIDTHIRIEGKDPEYYEEMGKLSEAMRMGIEALEERQQGEWIVVKDEKYGDNVKCPFCGKELAGTDLNFCCKCGADMRGAEK